MGDFLSKIPSQREDTSSLKLLEAVPASESDEEPLRDADDDSSIATNGFEDELGGSVAESSRSDEEYDVADQMEDGKSGGDDFTTRKEDSDPYSNHCGCFHREGKACKRCQRTLSMRHSRKLSGKAGQLDVSIVDPTRIRLWSS